MPAKTIDGIFREQRYYERALKEMIDDMQESKRLEECWEKNNHRHPGEIVSVYFYRAKAARCYCFNCDGHYRRPINDDEFDMLNECVRLKSAVSLFFPYIS